MKKSVITFIGLAALAPIWAQDATVMEASASKRMDYQDRQSLAEVPRLIEQFNLLAENMDQLGARLVKVESGSGDSAELRAEIDKLRGEVAELRMAIRREQDAMRREIVEDLSRRSTGISQQMQSRGEAALQAAEAAAKAAREQAEYTKRTAARATAPAPRASGGAAAKPAAPAYSAYYEHIVEPNQTLLFIAKGYETTVQKIIAANPGINPSRLRVGQKLIIPAEESSKAAPKKK